MTDEGIHRETAEGWDAIAASKYRDELEARVALLRSGRSGLLEVEAAGLAPLVRGAAVVHLQCSHGLDTLSLLDLGASAVVGVDISPEMIRLARELARRVGRPARWFRADVVEPPAELERSADVVYTGKGALPWITDLDAWASSVHRILRPGGVLYVFEGHPLDNLWDRDAGELRLRDDGVGYFDDAPRENPGFPADAARRARPGGPVMRERPWRPDQVMRALAGAGLVHRGYREYPDLFWNQFPSWTDALRRRLPHAYSLRFARPADR